MFVIQKERKRERKTQIFKRINKTWNYSSKTKILGSSVNRRCA